MFVHQTLEIKGAKSRKCFFYADTFLKLNLPTVHIAFLFPISASNGKVYVAQVKERAAARKIYDAAKKQGKTAGLVATK